MANPQETPQETNSPRIVDNGDTSGNSADDKIRRLTPRSNDAGATPLPDTVAREPQRSPLGAPPPQPSAAEPPPRFRRSLTRPILFALLPIALIVGCYVYVTGGSVMSTENAYVQADMVGVATDISGIVSEIDVRDNQPVKVGDVLFKLDAQPFQLALDRAEAQLGSTRNDLLALQSSYRDMQTQIVQAQADIDYYTKTFNRQQELAAKNFTPQSSFDDARHNLESAKQKLASVTQQLAGIAANLNNAPDAPVEDHPRYKGMKAARDEAARQLNHTTVRAPISGIVTKVPSLQPGQYLAAATSAFSIVATDHVWVQANPKETELTWVRPGQHATVEVDSYPGQVWSGMVDSISPASASNFSLLPAENTSGNWVKVVQRIPMRVRIDTAPDKPQLRAGMSVDLSVDTGHPRGVPEFIAKWFGRG